MIYRLEALNPIIIKLFHMRMASLDLMFLSFQFAVCLQLNLLVCVMVGLPMCFSSTPANVYKLMLTICLCDILTIILGWRGLILTSRYVHTPEFGLQITRFDNL